jgi:uncharacterized membrane protein YiaA
VFLPVDARQPAFTEMLNRLVAAYSESQCNGNTASLHVRRLFLRARDVSEFYQIVQQDLNRVMIDRVSIHEFLTAAVCTFINSIHETSELLFFGLLSLIIAIFSFLFWLVPFGICFYGAGALALLVFGAWLAFEPERTERFRQDAGGKLAHTCRRLAQLFDQFRVSFANRFLWENPRLALETVMFMVANGLLFTCFSPSTILLFSLLGIAVVEQWNPFGFGSPAEILVALIDF